MRGPQAFGTTPIPPRVNRLSDLFWISERKKEEKNPALSVEGNRTSNKADSKAPEMPQLSDAEFICSKDEKTENSLLVSI